MENKKRLTDVNPIMPVLQRVHDQVAEFLRLKKIGWWL